MHFTDRLCKNCLRKTNYVLAIGVERLLRTILFFTKKSKGDIDTLDPIEMVLDSIFILSVM